jgi:polyisoprenoid-binding protein YceI
MRQSSYAILLLTTALAVPARSASAQEPTPLRFAVQPGSRLWFDGKSTARGWSCDATRMEAAVGAALAAPATPIAEMSGKVRAASLTVPVAGLDCRNGTMNEHMRKALKADKHTEIRYRITSWNVTPAGADQGAVKMAGTLGMAGREEPLSVDATATREANGSWRVKGSRELRMTAWGVKPPTLFMGTMKVADPVVVHFDLVLGPATRAATASR